MKILRAIVKAWQNRHNSVEFLNGADYAADMLIARKMEPQDLLNAATVFEQFEEFTHFARGVRYAVKQYLEAWQNGQEFAETQPLTHEALAQQKKS